MANVEPVVSSNHEEQNGKKEEDLFLPIKEVAAMFGVNERSVYRGIRKGHVRSKRQVTVVSVSDYRFYRMTYGKHGPKNSNKRDPNEILAKILKLKAEGKSISAIAHQVFGYRSSFYLKKVRKLLETFSTVETQR